MERLSRKDLTLLLEYLRDLYTYRTQDQFTNHLVASITALIPTEVSTYNEINFVRGTHVYKFSPQTFPVFYGVQEVLENVANEKSPWFVPWRTSSTPIRLTDLAPVSTIRKWELYNELYSPLHVPQVLSMNLANSQDTLFPLTLNRHGKNFTERDRSMLALAGSHFTQTYNNAICVTRMKKSLNGYRGGLETLDQLIMAIDSKGHIEWATKPALECLGKFGHTRLHQGKIIPSPILEWVHHQNRLLDSPDTAPSANPQFHIEKHEHRLTVRLVRQGNHRLLFLEEHSPTPSGESLRRYGLTTREREVAGWVVRGKSNVDIAKILNICPETVHRHLGSVYLRLGIKSRGDILMKLQEGEYSKIGSSGRYSPT